MTAQPTTPSPSGSALDQYLSLTEAAARMPGRPSMWSLWRWCRKGVKIRGTTDRIKLRHVRTGSRLLTTTAWIEEFGNATAAADVAYFDERAETPQSSPQTQTSPATTPANDPFTSRPAARAGRRRPVPRQTDQACVNAELERLGS
jgi:hypothetical protein